MLQLPLEDLALQSNSVLLLDHHTEILIWQGREVGEQEDRLLSVANDLAIQRAENRFPRPYIMQFKVCTYFSFYETNRSAGPLIHGTLVIMSFGSFPQRL